jgi:hypothetical protein
MDRHVSPPCSPLLVDLPPRVTRTGAPRAARVARAACLAIATGAASLGLAACGTTTAWTPVPVEALPVPPDPPPLSEPGGVWAWARALQAAAAASARATATPPPAPAPPVSAISGDLPRDLEGTLAAKATCAKGECGLEKLVPKGVPLEGASPAAVWSHDLGSKGATLAFPRSADVDLYGVVVKGRVKIRGVEAGKAQPAGEWTAFHVPGAGATFTADGGPARLVLAAVSGGDPIADAAGRLHAKGAPKLAWKTRPAPIALVDLASSQDLAWAGGSMHARTAFEGDGQRASLGVLLASKDARVAEHEHDGSWELLAVLRPSGTFRRAAGPGAGALAAAPLTEGEIVAVPKATRHAWDGAPPNGLVAVQLFVPPGPEQRFKKAAAKAKAPPAGN